MKTPQMVILLAVVGCAAFAGGIVVERFLLTSGEYPDGESGRWGGEVGPQAPVIKESPSAASSRDLAESEEPAEADEDHSAPPPSTLEQFIDRLERGLVVDFTRAVAMIDRLPAGERRREFISRIASHWGHKDAPAALAWADELSGLERTRAIEHILHEWARIDPASASDYVARLPTSNRSLDWVHGVTRAWAEQDQAAAIAWGMAQQDPAVRRRALRGAAGYWASTDAAAAGAFAASLGDRYERHAVLEEVAHRWAAMNTEDALNWAESLQGEDRVRATSEILHELVGEDPRFAAQIYDRLAPSLPDQGEREGARRQVARELASRWSETAPREAGDWAMTLPESGEVQLAAVREVAEHWLRSDSLAASEWISRLPEGTTRDRAAGQVVEHIARTDHESAFAWASSVGDEGYQTELMHHVLERWNRNDPSAARQAFSGANLSTEQRQHFHEIFGEFPAAAETPESGEQAEP